MKKIEMFFERYSWLLKLGIFLFFVFWAGQGFYLYSAAKNTKTVEMNTDPESMRKLAEFAGDLVEKAKLKGKAYSPQEYFRDLMEIKRCQIDYSPDGKPLPQPQFGINQLWSLSFTNIREGAYSQSDIDEGKMALSRWLRENPKYICESTDQISADMLSDKYRSELKNDDWYTVVDWCLTLYLRGLLLSAMLYLVRMAKGYESKETYWSNDARMPLNKRRKGILATLLAGKAKFLLAVLAWPVMLLKYPANVFREIVVEAEMRRIGGLFRRFNPAEQLRIREIANGEQYVSWRKKFRRDHAAAFRYAFGIAVLATLAVYLLQPLQRTEAKETMRAGPAIAINHLQTDGATDDDVGSSVWCEGGWGLWSPPVISEGRCKAVDTGFLVPIIARCIDSVPRYGCFGRWAVSAVNR